MWDLSYQQILLLISVAVVELMIAESLPFLEGYSDNYEKENVVCFVGGLI